MGGEDKSGGREIRVEVIAVVLVKNEGLDQGIAGGNGEKWVDLRGQFDSFRKRDILG